MARKNRTRSMREQLHYAVKNSIAIGKSKRTDRQNGKAAGRLYSIENIEKIRDTCNNLAAWLHDQRPGDPARSRFVIGNHPGIPG